MNLRILANCCIGTAESEAGAGFLNNIFVDSGDLERIVDIIPGSPKILIGSKGTGKSLLFLELNNLFNQNKILSLYLTPSDIICSEPEAETPAVLQSFYYNCLVKQIAIKLGTIVHGFVSEDDAKLIKEAIHSGDKEPDFIQKVLPVLTKIGTMITSFDFSVFDQNTNRPPTRKLLKTIGQYLVGTKVFYLIIDEPDDIGIDGQETGRMWALLHACRNLCKNVPNIRCLISLRSEIWHLLCEDPNGRKNIDQYEPLTVCLTPTEEDIKRIIFKRLEYVASQCNMNYKTPYSLFFEGESTSLPPPATVAKSTWDDYLSKQSRGRPRDAIQLINLLALQAIKNGKEIISSKEVSQCATHFSETRLKSLCAEYKADFPDAERILSGFSSMSFENDAEDVKCFLQKRIGEYNPKIRGKYLRCSPDGVFILWRILHEMGFLNPRIPDSSMALGYRHISYNDSPNFVAQNNWNKIKTACWEIHPVYRSFLYSLNNSEQHRLEMIDEFKKNNNNPAFARRKRKSQDRY